MALLLFILVIMGAISVIIMWTGAMAIIISVIFIAAFLTLLKTDQS